MPWIYYNPHPKQKNVQDCVKRAICAVTGEDYMKVQRELNYIKNYNIVPELRDKCQESFRSLAVRNSYCIHHGWERVDVMKDPYNFEESELTGELFCQQHPHGKYILQEKNHWVACVDGVLMDTWDSTKGTITYYWIVEEGE